jgi:uncharacterized protein YdhG (YjbR/CyaY superfamily)
MPAIDEYLENIAPAQRAEYERIRKIVKQLVPEMEETISYGIPTFKYKGKYVLYFAAFKTHMSVYPIFKDLLEDLKDKLGDFKLTKETLNSRGTAQFTEGNPVPEILVREVVKRRLYTISGK